MCNIIDTQLNTRYRQFRSGIPNKQAIRNLFSNSGNLLPANVRQDLDNYLTQLPENDFVPANPSLCATPEQLEDFCSLRVELLNGRATPEQTREMCQSINEELLEDLGLISDAYQSPPVLPPMISDPGCDNGVVPFQTEESKIAASVGFRSIFDQLQIDFATDMIGNGPGRGNWGMVNMVLSDTMGNPLTAHWRKSSLLPY